MNLEKLKKNWEALGKEDPMWAVLTNPTKVNNKWEPAEFFATGVTHVDQPHAARTVHRRQLRARLSVRGGTGCMRKAY